MVQQKVLSIIGLIFSIWLIRDDSFNVFSAIKQHEPSYRIFRSLLEVNLMLFCVAVSLSLWINSIGRDAVRCLFHQPLFGQEDHSLSIGAQYHRGQQEEEDDHKKDNGTLYRRDEVGGDEALLHDSELLDAHFDEDGEVDPAFKDRLMPMVSPLEVTHVALDMLLAILVTLFFFTLSSCRDEQQEEESLQSDTGKAFWDMYSQIAAPTFPLLLFLFFVYRAFFPWKDSRRTFWVVMSYTLNAPWFPVSFRDGFLGDVLTSSVRPLKDIAFTIFYILFGLKGWWSTQEYRNFDFLDNADTNVPAMERSWIVHTVVLPMCSASPLWWRFLQNLRQAYDERQRWPYLGNALKYFLAAQVAMFGVFHPERKQNIVWLACFVFATLYQSWWDVYMDWNLVDDRGHLRTRRLYQSKAFYWTIAWVNFVLRFCWTLSFLPLHYLNSAGILTGTLVGNFASHIVAPVIGIAEIIRRTLWGFIRFEWEVIKTGEGLNESDEKIFLEDDDTYSTTGKVELQPMVVRASRENSSAGMEPFATTRKRSKVLFFSDMSSMNSVQVTGELALYATIFCFFCLVVAAHRGTY
ncbi:hypothetical protein ACA910_007934 [Epithemia clementina (nom. ined.)]